MILAPPHVVLTLGRNTHSPSPNAGRPPVARGARVLSPLMEPVTAVLAKVAVIGFDRAVSRALVGIMDAELRGRPSTTPTIRSWHAASVQCTGPVQRAGWCDLRTYNAAPQAGSRLVVYPGRGWALTLTGRAL